MVTLHVHRLLEKILLGSEVCPYSEPVDRLPVDHSDPEYGLKGYTLHFVLHNTHTQKLSGHFPRLCCYTGHIQRGMMELRAISSYNLSQHRCVNGRINMFWSSDGLHGSVENCCVMSLTLLDEFQKPFWCISSPVCVIMAKKPVSYSYSGEHFLLDYKDAEGQVRMKLVRPKQQECLFLISLAVFLPVSKINRHFSTAY
ncbi:hypothetical protein LDENG_00158570 [Lucifuga dentata]|nr:hypothetical protein LDENG_00158570 [Lucifuga dentata]